jgi:hypothetical protein
MSDMEGLSKAEETLKDLQEKLIQRDEQLESLELSHHVMTSSYFHNYVGRHVP